MPIDPQQAEETLLSGLGAKTKAVMVNQLKAANLRPSDQVDGRFLVDHASCSLLMGDQVPKSGAALMWLLDQVPEHARHESAWRLHVALRFNQQFWSDQHKDLNPELRALKGLERLDAIAQAIDDLVEPADRLQVWDRSFRWALLRHSFSNRLEEDSERERLVRDRQYLAWWSALAPDGRPRLAVLHEDAGATRMTATAQHFFAANARFVTHPLPLPGDPSRWLSLAFLCLCDSSVTRPLTRPAGDFPGDLELTERTRPAADVFCRLWKEGVRPPPEQLDRLCQMARERQPGALPALETCLLEARTQGPATSSAKRLRL